MQKLILTTALLVFLASGFSQSKEELQKQRQQINNEIEQTERLLNETRKTTKENLGVLQVINKRLDLQGNVIQNITGQIRYIDNDITKSQREVNRISRMLDTLKQEYAKSMVYAYKNRNNYDILNFIFSASSFNDAMKRITYLRSYRTYREQQGDRILHIQDMLHTRIGELSGNKQNKSVALQEQSKEMSILEKQQAEKERVVAKLKGRQKELTAQLTNKRKQDAKIKGLITAMIRREIDKANREAEEERKRLAKLNKTTTTPDVTTTKTTKPTVTRQPTKTESVLVTSEADRALDANFARNRGSLPWPSDGYILAHFGLNKYPDGNTYNNPGVSIGTQISASVKAIFDGEVTLVNNMDDKQVVFIKHGQYFTVYSNLSSSNVQRGDMVKTGALIGKAGANDDGQGEVDLILMKESNNVNPESWLRRK